MERTWILLSILERGKGKPFMEMLNGKDIRFHLQTVGTGTAPSEMMDIFGLGTNDKDIVVSFATESAVTGFVNEYSQGLRAVSGYRGLTMVTRLSAINRVAAEIISRTSWNQENIEKGVNTMTKSDHKHRLVLISVNQGYTDEVMQAAKQAGATGGTVIRGRLADAEKLEQFLEGKMEQEKDIIAILVPDSICGEIMETVNTAFGMNTPAQGIVCAVPVEKAFKI